MGLRASSVRLPELSGYQEGPVVVVCFERVENLDYYLPSTTPHAASNSVKTWPAIVNYEHSPMA